MRLIDADRLSEAIYDNVSAPYEEAVCAKEDCLTEIYAAPTVDAVPVVRCKDCKHWKFAQHINDNLCHRFDGDPWIPTEPNDFCSQGERKEGADNDT